MIIDKYKVDDPTYPYLMDGCSYPDAASVLGSMLGLCGCGDPDVALRYIRDILHLLNEQTQEILGHYAVPNPMRGATKDDAVNDFFKSDGERWFAFYMLDHLDLTEHGSSLGMGGWLTHKGKDILADLNEYFTPEVEAQS